MFKDKRRIILAKIEIPVEFFPDGSHVNHNDRACVNFYRCPLLPPPQKYDDVDFGEIIENLLSEGFPTELEDDENPMFIMKEPEIVLDVDDHMEYEFDQDQDQEQDQDQDQEQDQDQDQDQDQEQEQEQEQDQEQDQEEDQEQDETAEEYYILKSEIPSNPRPPSKNTSFKRNSARGKKSITYKMRGTMGSRISWATWVSDPEYPWQSAEEW